MTQIVPFDFESHAVRTVQIDGKPWFVAADVCRVLEIVNVAQAVRRLDDDEKGVYKVYTLGGEQEMIVVSESGLYGLSATSNKPTAKRFWKWVRSILLPALLRDGYYSLTGSAPDEALDEKRAYFEGLSDAQKEKARGKAAAMRRYDELVDQGWKRTEAARAVAEEHECSERTIWNMRHAT